MKTDPTAEALDKITNDINDHIMATLIAVILILAFALVWLGYTSNRKIKDLEWALSESVNRTHTDKDGNYSRHSGIPFALKTYCDTNSNQLDIDYAADKIHKYRLEMPQ